jgi:hypothetical protein
MPEMPGEVFDAAVPLGSGVAVDVRIVTRIAHAGW